MSYAVAQGSASRISVVFVGLWYASSLHSASQPREGETLMRQTQHFWRVKCVRRTASHSTQKHRGISDDHMQDMCISIRHLNAVR